MVRKHLDHIVAFIFLAHGLDVFIFVVFRPDFQAGFSGRVIVF